MLCLRSKKAGEPMSIEIKDGTLFSCMWFVEGKGFDWMAAVFKPEGGFWEASYRFRYYHDDKAFHSDDEKFWYSLTTKSTDDKTEKELCKAMDMTADLTQKHLPSGKIHKLVLKTDCAAKVVEAMKREKWAHFEYD